MNNITRAYLEIVQEIMEIIAFTIALMAYFDRFLHRPLMTASWAIFCLLTISYVYKIYRGCQNIDALMETMVEELGDEKGKAPTQ